MSVAQLLISAQEARNIEDEEIVTMEQLVDFANKSVRSNASRGFTQATIAVGFPVKDDDKTRVEVLFAEKGYHFMWLDRRSYSTFFISWDK